MKGTNNGFAVDGFSAVSANELMQVEGGWSWKTFFKVVKVVAAVAGAVIAIGSATGKEGK